jgi:hypothetical protein
MFIVPWVVALLFILNVVATVVLWIARDAEGQK